MVASHLPKSEELSKFPQEVTKTRNFALVVTWQSLLWLPHTIMSGFGREL